MDHVTWNDIVITLLQVKKITKEGEAMTVHLSCPCGDDTITGVDCVLYAIGRAPNTSNLGLETVVCTVPVLLNQNIKPASLGSKG